MNKIFYVFYEDIATTVIVEIVGVNSRLLATQNTVNCFFTLIRKKIFQESIHETKKEIDEYKFDESYFGAKQIRRK